MTAENKKMWTYAGVGLLVLVVAGVVMAPVNHFVSNMFPPKVIPTSGAGTPAGAGTAGANTGSTI